MTDIRKKLADKATKLAQVRDKEEEHPAKLNNFEDGNFYRIDLNLIQPDPNQPRKYFEPTALEDLTNSIRQKGILQPVVVRRDENGNIILVAGERRFRAARMAGLKQIPAIMTKGNPLEISIIENLQRENLNPIEEAEALSRMVSEHGYTQEKLALAVGKAKSTISETLSLNRLAEEIKEECRQASTYPRRLLVEISKQAEPGAMIALFQQIKDNKFNAEQVRTITRKKRTPEIVSYAAITTSKVASMTSYVKKLKIDGLEEEEKDKVLTGLQNLKRAIDDILK